MTYEQSIEIERPPAEVFAFLADPANLPRWQPAVVQVSADPPGGFVPNSRLTERRTFLGNSVRSTLEVTALEPDRRLDLTTVEGPVRFCVSHRLEPSGEGTRLTLVGEGEPGGALRLAGPLLRRVVNRQARDDLRRLKRLLESDQSRPKNELEST
jgi:carbon monoxide dehydrogenase subunit G